MDIDFARCTDRPMDTFETSRIFFSFFFFLSNSSSRCYETRARESWSVSIRCLFPAPVSKPPLRHSLPRERPCKLLFLFFFFSILLSSSIAHPWMQFAQSPVRFQRRKWVAREVEEMQMSISSRRWHRTEETNEGRNVSRCTGHLENTSIIEHLG